MLERTLPNRWYRLLADWINGHVSWADYLVQVKALFPEAVQHMYYDEMGHGERVYDATMELEQQIGSRTVSVQSGRAGDFRTQVKIWWGEMGEWSAAAMETLPHDYWYWRALAVNIPDATTKQLDVLPVRGRRGSRARCCCSRSSPPAVAEVRTRFIEPFAVVDPERRSIPS